MGPLSLALFQCYFNTVLWDQIHSESVLIPEAHY